MSWIFQRTPMSIRSIGSEEYILKELLYYVYFTYSHMYIYMNILYMSLPPVSLSDLMIFNNIDAPLLFTLLESMVA